MPKTAATPLLSTKTYDINNGLATTKCTKS